MKAKVVSLLRRLRTTCLILLVWPAAASAQDVTALFFESQPGDYIGAGLTKTYTQADGTSITVTSSSTSVTARISGPSFSFWWDLTLSAPNGIVPGVYTAARRYPFTPLNGLSFSGSGRGCNTLTGRFIVHEASYGPGGIEVLAADFEQHCEDADPGLFGSIRYHSNRPLTPFGGTYPAFELSVPTPSNGTVTSSGAINCGTGGLVCSQTFASATPVALTAVPDPGYIFAGWTDDCRGGTTTTVRVNGPKVCGAKFELDASLAPRTLVVFDSKAGDATGGGKPQVYSLANSVMTVQQSSNGATLTFNVNSIDATRDVSWRMEMSTGSSTPLAVGTYEGALRFSDQRPGLSVNFCSNSFGRFMVRELVLGTGNTVIRAAVDLEYHCGTGDGGFFAALRYNSTDSSTVPFGGNYPTYRLTVIPSANGTISGGGLNCGTGGAACQLTPSTPESVILAATPDPGYVFAGWTGGACIGGVPLTVRVNTIKICSAVFEPLVTSVPRSRVILDYMPDSRGTGTAALQEAFSALASKWTVSNYQSGRTLEFSVSTLSASGFTSSRRFSFSARQGQVLTEGNSYAAIRYPFPSATPAMDVTGSCNQLTGRFVVRELSVGSNGTVERAAIDFEQHCNDVDAGVFGTVRYNSTLDAIPFGGDYPRYRLVIPRPTHGRVTGPNGLDCSAASASCQADFGGPANVALTATANPGYHFAGWTGPCHGGESISFRLNTVRECAPLFESTSPASPRALLKMVGQPGDAILGGRTEIYSLPNSLWSVSASSSGSLSFEVSGLTHADETRWSISFRSGAGERLAPGTYTNASSSSSNNLPVLQIFGGNHCSVTGSTFTIRHLTFGAQNRVLRAGVDFEVHCGTVSSAAVFGTIEYAELSDAGRLALDKSSLAFTSTSSGNDIGQTTAPQTLRLSQSTGTNVSWTVSSSASWLRVTPTFGTGPATLTVSIEPVGLVGVATHVGTLTVSASGESLPPVTVSWTLLPEGGSPPFGLFETPIAFTENVTGAIALTGWALDDVEVTSVQIWRQPHPADPPAAIFNGPGPRNGKIYVGDATLVDGARPDVEAAYALPYRSRAGWGYMLLTRALIWDGQGFFTVHAIATDRDGHTTEIGSTAFSVNNALATKPFGTIDTPGQGVTASGLYANMGWVLTPNPGATVAAANVRVMIDGVFLPGTPSVSARPDVTAFFPAFDTSQAGRGLSIDTTAYADGLHTIAWIATDSTGQADGIGSRFFRVANGGLSSLKAAERAAARAVPDAPIAAVDAAPSAMTPIEIRRGFDPATPFETIYGSSEPYALELDQLDRIEVRVPGAAGARATGYLRALGQLRPLPPGGSFDPATGVFTWQPGAGFLGRYDIVIVIADAKGGLSRHELQVILRPRQP